MLTYSTNPSDEEKVHLVIKSMNLLVITQKNKLDRIKEIMEQIFTEFINL